MMLRRRLDVEMRPFRRAGNEESPTNGLLRAVRRALGIPVGEIAAKLGVVKSVVFAFETSEQGGTIKMATMERVAKAMGCKLVYGLVPLHGRTLEGMAEERIWRQMLEDREHKDREQGIGNREQKSKDPKSRERKDRDVGTRGLGTEGLASSSRVSAFGSGPAALDGDELVHLDEAEDAPAAGEGEDKGEMDGAGAQE